MFWISWHAATTQQKLGTNGCVQRIHECVHERMCTTNTQSINFTPRNTIGKYNWQIHLANTIGKYLQHFDIYKTKQ